MKNSLKNIAAWRASAAAGALMLGAAGPLFSFIASPAPEPVRVVWTTLGTNSGPVPNPERAEPANLLTVGDERLLIDTGDGAGEQLTKAGVPLASLRTLVLTHLHFDHTGGLLALLAERYQMAAPGVLTIYGPPGTQQTVEGLLAAMRPAPVAGASTGGPAKTVRVVEVSDGSTFTVGVVKVTAARNTHYSDTPGGQQFVSLSYRFDVPGRAIAFTGDTGPSEAVARLAKGVDLLVSEIIDPDHELTQLKQARPDLSAQQVQAIRTHFEHEHLTPNQAGLLAQQAGVRQLVLTHDGVDPAHAPAMQPGIAAHYHGPITFARDLDTFPVEAAR